MNIEAPVIRYHGSKFRLAPWVIQHLPAHTCYVEPFGGAAGVLMQKARSYAEVYNDLDGDIVNLFRVLQDQVARAALFEAVVLTPYARAEFERAWEPAQSPIERARRTIIRAQMGFGSAGATKGATGFRIDTKRDYGTAQSLWAQYPASIAAVGERLAGVLIENRPAIEVMRAHDAPTTLHYVDPPYVHDTRYRGASNGRYYRHEMDDGQHAELLNALLELDGMVVLSGYPCELYDQALAGWTRHSTSARISAGRGTTTRTECLWLNPACHRQSTQLGLFGS
ncbi:MULTISPECIES: DNA adenine methylase [unclassified Pseudomonas]|uniref:DNA adenine methylase n=1 Tax=unclassified Pseudomonas TaxID=196821 RepID=UPI000BD8EB5C|nr:MULTISPECIES: DNA adenine methylase [unclassified Pseudomonas]PVZ19967.1 site-specific DNA-adenine methylase [Pseudomonas sp. URIL14HWK12:I12]PVZ27033.1 site-specific DNA-adenine methylase [Pseudomonas sp. URIL14HWK12:I10]PVZ37922.1 site-specific DNA-adenine methylase [Pseudomonas sp. URIL14HWK12:I11]SNZ05130.1 DNA adenine methylase [Pseudomonas sp. URIL14HWK12:I9]